MTTDDFLRMKSRLFLAAVMTGTIAAAFLLWGCSTTESRIAEHRDLFNSLSPSDQQLVANRQIRTGMSQGAVWLAWGSPDQKAVGAMRGKMTETWIYVHYAPAYGYGYPYPYGPGFGFGSSLAVVHTRRGHSFVFVGDPFFDPFYYSYIPPSIPYPYRTVTFAGGRVVSFQSLVGAY